MKLWFYSITTFFNLLIWTSILVGLIEKGIILRLPLYLTFLNFMGCTFYLLAKLIQQIKRSEHSFFEFLDNILCKFLFTSACSVCSGYWLLCLGGPNVMVMSHTAISWITNIYVHGLIGVIMFIEVLAYKREHHEHLYYNHLIISLGFGIVYFTIIALFSEFAHVSVYGFLKLDISIQIGVFIVLTLISFNCYQLYHFILKKRFPRRDVTDSTIDLI
jgi:hypothetical protein